MVSGTYQRPCETSMARIDKDQNMPLSSAIRQTMSVFRMLKVHFPCSNVYLNFSTVHDHQVYILNYNN